MVTFLVRVGMRMEAAGVKGVCMWPAAVFAFFAGMCGANGIPHFVKGITREYYPCVIGNSPIPNLIAGWASFVLAVLLGYGAYMQGNPLVSSAFLALGVLLMGLFHAAGLAFGRKW